MFDIPGLTAIGFEALRARLDAAIAGLRDKRVIDRIWERDPTVWKSRDGEISNRLGWLAAPDWAADAAAEFRQFGRELAGEGFTHALLLGMGGSSLAPEVFRKVFGVAPGGLDLRVLDSTHPEAVLLHAESIPWDKTLFIVSSKSGTTLETSSLMKYFYAGLVQRAGEERAGRQFAAITDPDTRLDDVATALRFRRVFRGDPEIGGRFSALSAFGLGPAALLGRDLRALLDSAAAIARACVASAPESNPGAAVGTLLAASAQAGRDQCVILLSPGIKGFGAWIEQLIAESTGKEGRGILPLVRFDARAIEPFSDRLTAVHIGLAGDRKRPDALARLSRAGVPTIALDVPGPDALGGQFFLWEMATAVAGHILEINPFDQPNVAASKKRTEATLRAFRETGRFPGGPEEKEADPAEFSAEAAGADYIVIQAFLPPSEANELALRAFASKLQKAAGRAVTYDFGPRFLHSTGQLHQGDAGRGLFLQLTAGHARDAAIPDGTDPAVSTWSFGTLIDAQARGDREALRDKDRRVHSFVLNKLPEDIAKLAARIAAA
jgi:transaldolase/glucose-6-phosphate isomerase